MREIKFRGQTRRKGERVRIGDGSPLPSKWVCGGVFHNPNGDFSTIYGYDDFKKHTVYSDTIGQYTGLKDRNGKEIYEGDIVKLHQFLFDGDEHEKEITVLIEYMENEACFGAVLLDAKEIKSYMGYSEGSTEKITLPICQFYGLHEESYTILGNKFDNPGLLEVQNDK